MDGRRPPRAGRDCESAALEHPGELRGGGVRHCARRRRAPGRPAAQASPRRACWGTEISFGLKTCTRRCRAAIGENGEISGYSFETSTRSPHIGERAGSQWTVWRWTQSTANLSPPEIPCNRDVYREFSAHNQKHSRIN